MSAAASSGPATTSSLSSGAPPGTTVASMSHAAIVQTDRCQCQGTCMATRAPGSRRASSRRAFAAFAALFANVFAESSVRWPSASRYVTMGSAGRRRTRSSRARHTGLLTDATVVRVTGDRRPSAVARVVTGALGMAPCPRDRSSAPRRRPGNPPASVDHQHSQADASGCGGSLHGPSDHSRS